MIYLQNLSCSLCTGGQNLKENRVFDLFTLNKHNYKSPQGLFTRVKLVKSSEVSEYDLERQTNK